MPRRPGSVLLFVALISLLSAPAALGQDGDSVSLSLDECLRTALANNLDLVSARNNPAIAELQIGVSEAPFDSVLGSGANYTEVDSSGDSRVDRIDPLPPPPTLSTEFPESSFDLEDLNANLFFENLMNFGGSYKIQYNYSDDDQSQLGIDGSTTFLTSADSATEQNYFSLEYTMPLLKGFGAEVNRIDVLLAQNALTSSYEDLRLTAMNTIKAVEDAYWDLLAAREALRISRLALTRAEDLLDLNRKKVEVGTLAPIEITEAEAGVATNVELVIVRETELEDSEDALLKLLAVPADDAKWNQSILTADRPSFSKVEVDLDNAIATALERRVEIVNARQSLANDELSERVAKKGKRHQLDFNASVTPGRTDDADTLTIRELAPATFAVADETRESDRDDWTLGLTYRYPIRNRAAKANYAIAQLNTQKSAVALRSVEQDIRVEVRSSARGLESGHQRIEAASKNVELQEKKLEAEQKKFDNGMSTSFEVLQFQNDLADAELSQIQAALDYLKSVSALELSKGTLLEARGLTVGRQ
ncbi:MAG: TolC family protein [bacterium]|nr:TolC family protein [bacterium]